MTTPLEERLNQLYTATENISNKFYNKFEDIQTKLNEKARELSGGKQYFFARDGNKDVARELAEYAIGLVKKNYHYDTEDGDEDAFFEIIQKHEEDFIEEAMKNSHKLKDWIAGEIYQVNARRRGNKIAIKTYSRITNADVANLGATVVGTLPDYLRPLKFVGIDNLDANAFRSQDALARALETIFNQLRGAEIPTEYRLR